MENITTLAKAEEAIQKALTACNSAISESNLDAYGESRTELEKCIAQFNGLAEKNAYKICSAADQPIVQLVKMFFFNGLKVSEDKAVDEDGKKTDKLLSVSTESVKKRLNLSKFVKNYGQNKSILASINELYDLMLVKEKMLLAMTPVEFAAEYKKGSDYTKSVYDALKKGNTPTSNTQICKKLQEIVNACGVESRIVNLDIHFLERASFNADAKEIAQLKPVTGPKFASFIMDVLAYHVTGKQYQLTEKKKG